MNACEHVNFVQLSIFMFFCFGLYYICNLRNPVKAAGHVAHHSAGRIICFNVELLLVVHLSLFRSPSSPRPSSPSFFHPYVLEIPRDGSPRRQRRWLVAVSALPLPVFRNDWLLWARRHALRRGTRIISSAVQFRQRGMSSSSLQLRGAAAASTRGMQ